MKTPKARTRWIYIAGLALLFLVAALGIKAWTKAQQANPLSSADQATVITRGAAPDNPETRPDVFQDAVDFAEQAAAEAQSAQTADQWQQVAQLWRNAAMALNQVPSSSTYYELAHQKIDEYANNASYAELAREAALERKANLP